MFTGIVTACGTVAEVERQGERLTLTIEAPYGDLAVGESIAVNGACLTAVAVGDGRFRVEAVITTRGRTRFGDLRVGDRVNLERAMAASDRFGGHWVQGHVDGVGEVQTVQSRGDALLVILRVPPDVAEFTVPYGSIAVDGVSLTVNAIPEPGLVEVSLIPYTRQHTTLGGVAPGDRVHIEGDIIGKYVRQLVQQRGPAPLGRSDAVWDH